MSDRTPAKIRTRNFVRVVSHIGNELFRGRWAFTVTVTSLFIALMSVITIVLLVPLKQDVPYFLVETGDGNVVLSDKIARRFEVTDANIKFFTGKMLRYLLTIDEQLVSRLNELRDTMLRGAAISQFRNWVFRQDRPILRFKNDPSLRREVRFDSDMTIIKTNERRGQIVAFFTLRTLEGGREGIEQFVAKVDYALVPPKTYKDVLRNPSGFYVTGFEIGPR